MILGLVSALNSKGPAVIIDHYRNHHHSKAKPDNPLANELNDPNQKDRFLNASGTVLILFAEVVALARAKSADG